MARADLLQHRPLIPAGLGGVAAAGVERAAVGRDARHIGGLARYGMQPVAAGQVQAGHRVDQAQGVGVVGPAENVLRAALLHDRAAVHDFDGVRVAGHYAQVVGKDNQRRAEILAQLVEAEKSAQANVIRRREETAATRSLLNTAKVMENNPVALRLKELETLERVAERIDNISVFGGLDQVLHGLVNIKG